MDRIKGLVSLLHHAEDGEETYFTIRAFRIGIDGMRDVRAREESRIDFKMFGLSHWQKELYLLK